jgi:hypothetical protein
MDCAGHTLGWKEILIAMGTAGFLILLTDVVMIGLFIDKLAKRRMSWILLWLGAGCVVAGILGTVLGMIGTYSLVAGKGGAASPADLSEGMAKALMASAVGLGSMLLALVLTGILHGFRRSGRPPRDEGGGPG